MGTTSSALTASQVGSSATAPLTFNGVSTYSSDFQSILTRAVGIATLPLTALQNQDADVLQKQTELQSFGQSVSTLTSAFTQLTSAVSSGSIQAASSDTTSVTANATGAATASSYTINSITSLATSASETSATGYADSTAAAVSTTGSLKLVFGSQSYNITLASGQNNLNGLVNAINSLGVGVTASVLTTGNGTTPDYLSLSANSPGATTLQLFDDPTGANKISDHLSQPRDRRRLQIQRNPGPAPDQHGQRSGSGLEFHASERADHDSDDADSVGILIEPEQRAEQLRHSLQRTAERGGWRVGHRRRLAVGRRCRAPVLEYPPSNRILPRTWGVRFEHHPKSGGPGRDVRRDWSGHVRPHGSERLEQTQVNSAFSFIGTATAGFGAIGSSLTQLSDPVTGSIQAEQASYTATDTRLKSQITALQTRINTLQTQTQARLATYDSLIASLQSQQTVLSASIQSINLALFGQNPTSPA